jgi:hypothetical protein
MTGTMKPARRGMRGQGAGRNNRSMSFLLLIAAPLRRKLRADQKSQKLKGVKPTTGRSVNHASRDTDAAAPPRPGPALRRPRTQNTERRRLNDDFSLTDSDCDTCN